VDEQRDIYRKPASSENKQELPAYERSPDQIRNEVRRKVILFGLLLLAFGVYAAITAWNEWKKTDNQELRSMLSRPTAVTNAAARVVTLPQPLAPTMDDFNFREISTNVASTEGVSPQKIADAMAQIRAGQQYLAARDWDRAETHATNALAIWPEMNLALRMRGVVFTQRGQFDEAIEVLEHALRRDPFSAEALNTLGTAYMQKRVFDKAEELFQTALNIRPGYAVAEVNLGLLYLLTKRYEPAIEHLQAAAPQLPDNVAIPNNLGVCFIRAGRYEEARRCLRELIRREPRRAAPYFNVAMSYSLEKDVTNAMQWVRQGAEQCSPVDAQRFLMDADFANMRDTQEYQKFIRELYPQLPAGPKS
jgi:Flp pilus assembly protein TadD